MLFFNYLKHAKIARDKLTKYDESVICSAFYSYVCLQMISGLKSWVSFDGYPAGFLFFLFLGIILKLGSDKYKLKKY